MDASTPAAVEPWTRCMEYLPQKRRRCTGVRKAGSEFCGAHVKDGRMPCPIDPTHTIFARDVEKHVPRCTRTTALARMTALPCYARGINAGSAPEAEVEAIAAWRRTWDVAGTASTAAERAATATEAGPPVHAAADGLALARMLSRLDLGSLASRVGAWHELHCSSEQASRGEAGVASEGDETGEGRHERQARKIAAALLGPGGSAAALGRAGAASPPPLLVEFGAGKGLLGATAQVAVAAAAAGAASGAPPELLLVERGANRSKADSRPQHSGEASDAPLALPRQRIRMDISDLALERHPAAWGARLASLTGETWENAAGHDRAAEARRSAAAAAATGAAGASPGCKRRRGSGGGGEPPPSTSESESEASANAVAPASDAPVPRPAVPLCALGKHLCGGATDLALRCVARAAWGDALTRDVAGDGVEGGGGGAAAAAAAAAAPPPPPEGFSGPAPRLAGIAIATCCHHSCGWGAYVGKGFFRGVLGAGPVEFEALRMLSSWGCMPLQQQAAEEPPHPQQEQPHSGAPGSGRLVGDASVASAAVADPAVLAVAADAAAAGSQRDASAPLAPPLTGAGGLDRAARVALGRRCKSLIDAGRVWFLRTAMARAAGLEADSGAVRMTPYCSGADSPENMLLLLPLSLLKQ